jgi:hypothetical protein
MRPDDDFPIPDYDAELRALFDALPHEAPTDPNAASRLAVRLRHEGFFVPSVIPSPSSLTLLRAGRVRDVLFSWRLPALAAAAVVLMALSAWVGWTAGRHGSLEEMLSRTDLTVADRVLLLQRAGSAYVTAAQSYANATARTDTTAIEVASRVLLGAAHAVARNHLDAGIAEQLTSVLQQSATRSRPTVWF